MNERVWVWAFAGSVGGAFFLIGLSVSTGSWVFALAGWGLVSAFFFYEMVRVVRW